MTSDLPTTEAIHVSYYYVTLYNLTSYVLTTQTSIFCKYMIVMYAKLNIFRGSSRGSIIHHVIYKQLKLTHLDVTTYTIGNRCPSITHEL